MLREEQIDIRRQRAKAGKFHIENLGKLLLMMSLPWSTWERLILWMALGIAVYFGYGFRRSRLRTIAGPARVAGTVEG